MTEPILKTLLQTLPDIPRWVETRSMLLTGRCVVHGDATNCVVKHSGLPLVAMIGRPEKSLMELAISADAAPLEILAPPENEDHARQLLPDWTANPVTLHLLRPDRARSIDADATPVDVRQIDPHHDLPDNLPKPLNEEFQRVADWMILSAKFVGKIPVAFCCAYSITETLWDVSIDTLEDYRRKGYAEECVKYMIRLMHLQGKEPVWGALDSNTASLRLAQKLGFEEVDRLFLFNHS